MFIIPGDISSLIDFFNFAVWFFYGGTMTALLVLRYTQPDTTRPFKVGETPECHCSGAWDEPHTYHPYQSVVSCTKLTILHHDICFGLQLLSFVGNTWLQCCLSGPLSRQFLVGLGIFCLLSFLRLVVVLMWYVLYDILDIVIYSLIDLIFHDCLICIDLISCTWRWFRCVVPSSELSYWHRWRLSVLVL